MVAITPVSMPTPSASRSLILSDALSEFLLEDNAIRVVSTGPLPADNKRQIRDARSTYALMTVMSESLGVNCTFCHNSRAFYSWEQSTPQRVTAWYGIRMAHDINRSYLAGLAGLLRPDQHGPAGLDPLEDHAQLAPAAGEARGVGDAPALGKWVVCFHDVSFGWPVWPRQLL